MKTLLLALVLTFSSVAHADTLVNVNASEFELNRASPNAMARNRLGGIVEKKTVRTIKAVYDFSVLGGSSAAAISLKNYDGTTAVIPNSAIVRNCVIDVITTPTTSTSATIAIGTGQAANDLKTATAVASYTGLMACIPVGSAASSIKMTADRTPTVTVATGFVTSGKINVLIDYSMSE